MVNLTCIWCGRGYPPAAPTREHVLPDYLGVSARLPEGVVCKECNNKLNDTVDRPLKSMFQAIITGLRVRSGKRSGVASVRVELDSNVGRVPAVLGVNGLHLTPRLVSQASDGARVNEQWVVPEAKLDVLLEGRKEKYDNLQVETGPVHIRGMTASLRGTGSVIKRATVKAGLNCVAWREPALVARGLFDTAIQYVLDEDGITPDLPGEASEALMGHIDAAWCRPEHRVIVQADRRQACWMELRLFGDIFTRVRVEERWSGPALALDEWFPVRRFAGMR